MPDNKIITDRNKEQYSQTQRYLKDTTSIDKEIYKWIREGKKTKTQVSSKIRASDDKHGLVSRMDAGELSACAGMRYRTKKFMDIEKDDRSGGKIDKDEDYGVHVEHSIPVSVKYEIICALIKSGSTMERVIEVLNKLRFGVAMTRKEGKSQNNDGLIKVGFAWKHPDVIGDLSALKILKIHPFARYTDEAQIFDMKSREEVNLEATIESLMP